MGKMKEIYMDLWDRNGGDIPPDYDLAGYLAMQKAEYELELRKDAEAVEAFEREKNQQDDDSVHGDGSSNQKA